MLQKLGVVVGVVVGLLTIWVADLGMSWSLIAQFDFWLFAMIYFSSLYLLAIWDERRGQPHATIGR